MSPELHGERLLVGANFASAGIGILNDTGIQFVSLSSRTTLRGKPSARPGVYSSPPYVCLQANIIRITKQLQYFEQYQQRLSSLIGPEKTERLVNEGLVLITLGGNDFVNNYYLVPFSLRSRQFALPDYVRYLVSEYKKILSVRIFSTSCFLRLHREVNFSTRNRAEAV